jgi:hypothetical protein
VSEPVAQWSTSCRDGGLLRSVGLLVSAVAVLYAALLPIAIWQQGPRGIWESAAALLVCLLPAMAALVLSYRLLGTPQALAALLLSMGLRLMPPLVVALLLAARGTGADYFHFVCYLLLFYVATLAAETLLFVQLIRTRK